MSIITLTTDWGYRSHYSGAVKGKILGMMPDARIVEITHNIKPFNMLEAAFVLRHAYPSFPEGTVHVIGLNTEASINHPHVVVKSGNQYFIGSDNGIFPLLLREKPEVIIELTIHQDSEYFTFCTRDIFIKAACHIAQGLDIHELGDVTPQINEKITFQPIVDNNIIKGKVVYIDSYENVFTNITEEVFRKVIKNATFSVEFRGSSYPVRQLSQAYSDVPEGEFLTLVSSTGLLQIAINRGNAAGLLGLNLDDVIRIEPA